MRMLRRIVVVLAVVSVLGLVGCSGSPAPSGGTGTGTTGGPTVAVSMQNLAFNPADITVAVGGTVTFTNNDTVEHNIAGDTWSSGVLAPGATFSQTFPSAGTFPIRCTIHPSMTGTITVK